MTKLASPARLPGRGDSPFCVLATTLFSLAAINYWVYDRFVLSYALATQCVACDAPAPPPSSLERMAVGALAATYLVLLMAVSHAQRRVVWGWGTLLIALSVSLELTRAYRQAVAGQTERWAAVNEPGHLALYCGAILTLSTVVLALRGPRRRELLMGAPAIVGIAGVSLMVYGASSWFRAAEAFPMATAALLLAGTEDTVAWWQRSLAALTLAGAVLAILASRSRRPLRRGGWSGLIAGLAALALTVPHALDALHPLALREAVPESLSRASSCLAGGVPEAVPIQSATQRRAGIASPVGYLAEPMARPARELQPLLQEALTGGIRLVVVPATRLRSISTHTLGTLHFDEVCLGGKFRLGSGASARPLADFATLGDLLHSDGAVDPSRAAR